ncbi:hypothetical protein V8G69_00040 [Gaetbulibacter sp. M235]|uniref:MGH1-like glycoside hydrolase domain-containing protein n=1 Tax=Gaetbulibacter sp. M235 TaxID=3126510 RepID=UPI00374ED975
MKNHIPLFFLLIIISIETFSQSVTDTSYYNSLKYKHDLNLPNWGPYTKKYIGVSNIPDIKKGIRFDLSVFPGFYRRKVELPSALYESGFHPWEASPNLEYFSFRHELEWKDQVYTDISYSEWDENSRLIRINCVNNTNLPQSIVLHMMASINFPSIKEYDPDTPLEYSTIQLPENTHWIDALNYTKIKFAKPAPTDHLVYDGKLRGEIRDHGLVNGSGIGNGFGNQIGDQIEYEFNVTERLEDAVLLIRYKMEKDFSTTLQLSGLSNEKIVLNGDADFSIKQIRLNQLKTGNHHLSIVSKGNAPIILDGFVIINKNEIDSIKIESVAWDYIPEVLNSPLKNSIILKYKNIDNYYGLYWDYPDFEIREWFYKNLGDGFRKEVNGHTKSTFYDGTKGHYTNAFLRPINMKPNSSLNIYGLICSGSLKNVEYRLKNVKKGSFELVYNKARENLVNKEIVPAGEKYLFSQKRMEANTITDIVYPVYTQRQYIKHHAPGRWWDCLYTWDAGFIGIGLSQLNIQRGIENLNAYLNETDEQSAFIHHGTPLPVQHYLYQELWNKTQSKEFLENYYPKLKRYYEFLAGRISGSTTRNLESGLIRTWDYFYNSGGWDDYPPQRFVHQSKLEQSVTPVVNTAHQIRIAKILQMTATYLNLKDDIIEYNNDIQQLGKALQDDSWDEKSGYFGYVEHNEKGEPIQILKYNDTINFNKGMDGASPLISGICTPEQKNILLNHLKTKGELWSDVGLSAVDQSAPYYAKDGYWNGTVWMPHQWFFWKTMLDLGEADFAFKIASKALDVWKREVENTYNCFEHFVIETGRGAGWHQFSGLSNPVLSWFNAYYAIGSFTTGFNIWIQDKKFNEDKSSFFATLKIFDDENSSFSVIACMNPQNNYQVYWNDKLLTDYKILYKGVLSITITTTEKEGTLKIVKAN